MVYKQYKDNFQSQNPKALPNAVKQGTTINLKIM